MENFELQTDIELFCVTADSFPAGVMAAHQKLHATFPMGSGRHYFGISWPDGKGSIIYKAGAEMLAADEEGKFDFERFTVKQGTYTSMVIVDYMADAPNKIGAAFKELLANPDIDPNGQCVEMYDGMTSVRCMVRLIS